MIENPDEPPQKAGPIAAGEDLECLLESLVRGGATSNFRNAKLIHAAFEQTSSLDERRLFAAEIFCKLMQALEDLGAFCIYSLSKTNDLSAYFGVPTRRIVEFYGKCREGLADSDIEKIYGLPTIDELLHSGKIAASHSEQHESALHAVKSRFREQLRKRGTVFAGYDTAKQKYEHSDLVNMYFNTKHGVRVFLPNEIQAKAMAVSENQVAILIGPKKDAQGNEVGVNIGSFSLDALPRMLDNTAATCSTLKELAEIRLKMRKDPFFVFTVMSQTFRPVGTVSGIFKMGRNEKCFCGSGDKFKKCHGR